MILNKFKSIDYNGYKIPNLFVNLGLIYDLIKRKYILREYTISGSPRPEQLSYNIYGTTEYEWILLLVNNIIDPWHGWLRPDDVVRALAIKKYKDFGGETGIHHYYDPLTDDEYYDVVKDSSGPNWYNKLDTDKVYPQFSGQLIPVTNVEYELNRNEMLRKIKIIPPGDIRSFVDEFMRSQNGDN